MCYHVTIKSSIQFATHSPTHPLTHPLPHSSLTHSLAHSLTPHVPTHWLTDSLMHPSLPHRKTSIHASTHAHPCTHAQAYEHPHSHAHTHTHTHTPTRRGSRIFERGGSRRRYRIFHKHPPPLDIGHVTSSDLRKFEKHPHSWTFTSAPPPLGHCPRDVIRPQKNWKTPPLLDIHKRGGSNFGPNVKKPTSWPKRGGSGPPGPPPWIRHCPHIHTHIGVGWAWRRHCLS